MDIRRETIGTTVGHEAQEPMPVEAFTLDTGTGFAITVWTYGATLINVLVPDRNGQIDNVVVRLPHLSDYEHRAKNPFLGATVGRYARCIAGGRFQLDGREHQVVCNFGDHHFHGGLIGFDRFVWSAEAEVSHDQLILQLCLERPDGDQGYPGAISVSTTYRLTTNGILTFEHQASTMASTVVDITNHSYWNLAGAGQVNNHLLTINAHRVLMVDNDLIPIGPPVNAVGTWLDFTSSRLIADCHLDHCFALDDSSWAAELYDPASGRVMLVRTDQPGLQVYSADGYALPRAGLALQTGTWPNSPNQPDFPSSRLDPGMIYRHCTVHSFSLR